MKKIIIISVFVLALSINASAECGDMHTDRCLVDSNPQSTSTPTQQEKRDIFENKDEISLISFLNNVKIQIIRIIR